MAALLDYKCPCCNGSLRFESGIQKLKCPYCDTEFEMEALQAMDAVLNEPREDQMQWQDSQSQQWQEGEEEGYSSYVCQSCGGQILGDANTAATSCPYCDSPVVLAGRLAGELKPDLVIPFKLNKEQAVAALEKHLSGKPLLPKIFKSQNQIQQIKGIYVPFWLFDADADGTASYRATRVRFWSDSNYNYTETRHYSVRRSGNLSFAAVPADGSSKIEDALMESIEPYDMAEAVDFQTAYLAGYLADKYDIGAEESIPRVNERIKASTEQALRSTVVGYSSVIQENCTVRLEKGQTRYALLPVWLLNTKYQDKTYTFAMNGQTGKFVGNLPTDWNAFWLWLLGLTAGIGVVGTVLSILFG